MGMDSLTHDVFDEFENPLLCIAYRLLLALESKNQDDVPNAKLSEGVAEPLNPPQWVTLDEYADQRYNSIRIEDSSMHRRHLLEARLRDATVFGGVRICKSSIGLHEAPQIPSDWR